MPTSPSPAISCVRCHRPYPAVGGAGSTTAQGCATDLHDGLCEAGYGSRHDGACWQLEGEALENGTLCDGCVDALLEAGALVPHTLEPPTWGQDDDAPIVCARCSGVFEPSLMGGGQGYGCASSPSPDGLHIHGHFGSTAYDMTSLRVVRPQEVVQGNLCDGCLRVLVASGALEEEPPPERVDPFAQMSPEERDAFLAMLDDALAQMPDDPPADPA